jgi:hypothetical protein
MSFYSALPRQLDGRPSLADELRISAGWSWNRVELAPGQQMLITPGTRVYLLSSGGDNLGKPLDSLF